MSLALINGFNYYSQSLDFALVCRNNHVDVVVFTYNSCERDDLINHGIRAYLICASSSFKVDHRVRHCENVYYGLPSKLIDMRTDSLHQWFSQKFSELNIKAIYQQPGGELHRIVASKVADEFGIKEIVLGEKYLPGLTVLYKDLSKSSIWRLTDRAERPIDMEKMLLRKKVIHKRSVFSSWQSGKWKRLRLHVIRGEWLVLYASVSHKFKLSYKRSFELFFPGNNFVAVKGKQLVYFNLNVPAESELHIRNVQHAKQMNTVKFLIRAMPDSHFYVKFHPSPEGFLGLVDSIKLSLMKNATLLKRNLYSTDIMEKVDIVAAVSGSVLIEAIIRRKKILLVGTWYYERILRKHSDFLSFGYGRLYYNIEAEAFLYRLSKLGICGAVNEELQDLNNFSESIRHIIDEED